MGFFVWREQTALNLSRVHVTFLCPTSFESSVTSKFQHIVHQQEFSHGVPMEDTKQLKDAFDAAQDFLDPVLKRGTLPRQDKPGSKLTLLKMKYFGRAAVP